MGTPVGVVAQFAMRAMGPRHEAVKLSHYPIRTPVDTAMESFTLPAQNPRSDQTSRISSPPRSPGTALDGARLRPDRGCVACHRTRRTNPWIARRPFLTHQPEGRVADIRKVYGEW